MPKKTDTYIATVGLNYPVKGEQEERRVEEGEEISDLSQKELDELVEMGFARKGN